MSKKLCMDCKKNKHNVILTGSFLCNTCYEKMIAYYNLKYGNEVPIDMVKKSRQEILQEVKRLLAETDLTVREISEKTGMKENNIYYHSNRIRKKKVEEKVKAKGGAKPVSNDYSKLEKEYAELSIKTVEMRESYSLLLKEKEGLELDLKYLEDDLKRLQEENEKLQYELKKPVNDTETTEQLALEKQRHEALLKYLSLSVKI